MTVPALHVLGPLREITASPGMRVLMVDLTEIDPARCHNVTHALEQAQKHPANPVLPLGALGDWDGRQARPWPGTVLYDADHRLFKCWYAGVDHLTARRARMGYAVSPDGVAWHKPSLGLVEWRGSTANNLVLDRADVATYTAGCILKDVADPDPSRRYKSYLPDDAGNKVLYVSADGLRWRKDRDPVLTFTRFADGSKARWPHPDFWLDVHQVLFDPQDPDPARRYKAYGQSNSASRKLGYQVRKGGLAYGPDPTRWTKSRANTIDPDDGLEEQCHFQSVLPYCGLYLMLYEYNWREPLDGRWVGDLRLAVSRDGITFTRVLPQRPVVARGARPEWDSAFLVTASDWVLHDDRIWIYYTGASEDWVNWPGVAPEGLPSTTGGVHTCKMGLATLRLDGLGRLETWDGEMPGQVTTQPLTASASGPAVRLWVNADGLVPRRSWIEVETVDAESGAPLAADDGPARTTVGAGGVRVPTGQQLRLGQRCRLRFQLYGQARLYAFGFEAAE